MMSLISKSDIGKGKRHKMQKETTITYLALYTGPMGPISKEFEAQSVVDARRIVIELRNDWYSNGEDDLELAIDATGAEINEALLDYIAVSRVVDDGWTIYQYCPESLIEKLRDEARLAGDDELAMLCSQHLVRHLSMGEWDTKALRAIRTALLMASGNE